MDINEATQLTKALPPTDNPRLNDFAQNLDTASLDDERWNELFDKYMSNALSNEDYFYLKTSRALRNNEQPGYISYSGETGRAGEGKKTWYTIDLDDVHTVQDESQASVFTEKDINVIIQALRADKRVSRLNRLQKRSVPKSVLANFDYARELFRFYFKRLCGDRDNAIDWLRDAESKLYSLCRTREKYPLAGNSFLKIFSEAFKNPTLNAKWSPSTRVVIIFNNLIADGEMSSANLMKPTSFLTCFCFNENLSRFTTDEIEELFSFFAKALSLARRAKSIDNPTLAGWEEVNPQLARQMLLKPKGDADPFKAVVANPQAGLESVESLGSTLEDEKILEWEIRHPNEVASMLDKLTPNDRDETYKSLFLITDLNSDGRRASEWKEEDGEASFRFPAMTFRNEDIIKLVYTLNNADDRGKRRGLSINSIDLSSVPEVKKLDDDTLEVVKDFKASLKGVLDLDEVATLSSLTFVRGEEKDQIKKEEPDQQEGEGTEEPTPDDEVTSEDTSFDASGYLAIDPKTGEEQDDRRADVKLRTGDRFVGLNGKVYVANRDGDYDIQKGSKIYLPLR